jgi:uncharacterized SAM-binding protein YcdF (DUF218 family)
LYNGRCRVGSRGLFFGEHFNTTDRPHAWYLKACLVAHGVPEEDVLAFAESRSTIEDATLSYPIARQYGARRVIVVTSDYHAARARYVFEHVYPDVALEFAICPTDAEHCDLDLPALEAHEQEALAMLRAQGLPHTEEHDAIPYAGKNGASRL